MSNALMDISLHADTQHRAVDLLRYQFIREIIDTSELTISEAIFRWDTWRRLSTAIHNPMRVMEYSNWLRYSWFCIPSSARSDLSWSATEATEDFYIFFFFTFLLLNQEHGVNNERYQSIQSVRHSKRTHRLWPREKDCSTRKRRRK